MSAARVSALVAAVALAGSCAWQGPELLRLVGILPPPPFALREPGLQRPPPITPMQVTLPPIEAFAHYYGGDDDSWRPHNPFVPWAEREILIRKESEPQTVPETQPRERPPVIRRKPPALPPPPAAPAIAPINLAALQLPEVIGGVIHGERRQVMVDHAGERKRMAVGDRIGTWTLDGISGNSAWFVDAGGDRHRVPVGVADGDTAMVAAGPAGPGGGGMSGIPGVELPPGMELPPGLIPGGGGNRGPTTGPIPGGMPGGMPGGGSPPAGIDGPGPDDPPITGRGGNPGGGGNRGGANGGGDGDDGPREPRIINGLDVNEPEVQNLLRQRPSLRRLLDDNPNRAVREIRGLLGK